MVIQKFSALRKAVEAAALFAEKWTDQGGRILDRTELFGVCGAETDGKQPESGVPGAFYVLDETGAVGFTRDGGKTVAWLFRPSGAAAPAAPAFRTCSGSDR